MKKYKLFLVGIAACFFVASCGGDEEKDVNYANTISNDLKSCGAADCHNSGSVNGSLVNYADVKTFFDIKGAIVFSALRYESGVSAMPKTGDRWFEAKVQRLQDWVNAGLPE